MCERENGRDRKGRKGREIGRGQGKDGGTERQRVRGRVWEGGNVLND